MTADASILAALRKAGPDGVSGMELARQLGISRAAVWARVEELRKAGYGIAATPHQGYLLRTSPDKLHADDLLARLGPGRIIGHQIHVFSETASTNDVVDKLAHDGVEEGVVVFAESQTKGRGRLGRTWSSPAGKGLWFSVLLRPPLHPSQATQVTILAAVAVARAIQKTVGLTPGIKWPNDIHFRSKKCGGILLELSAELDHIRHLILGIGLDVNIAPEEFPPAVQEIATSLATQKGGPIDRPALATSLLVELDEAYRQLCSGAFGCLADEWAERCTTLGQRVSIRVGPREITGTAESLDDEGTLLVRTEFGRLERVVGGDVTLLVRG